MVCAKNGYTYAILMKSNIGIMYGLKITTDVIQDHGVFWFSQKIYIPHLYISFWIPPEISRLKAIYKIVFYILG